jgi:hypothetical protein
LKLKALKNSSSIHDTIGFIEKKEEDKEGRRRELLSG